MVNLNDSEYHRTIRKQYRQMMEQAKANLDKMDRELPPPVEDFGTLLKERGISRRSFIKWTSVMTGALMLPPIFKPLVARAAEQFNRLPVVWLHFADCTGSSEAFLRTSYPNVDDVLLDTISLEYHETLMAAAGDQAEACLEKCLHDFAGKFICVIEGAIPLGLGGKYLRLGPKGKTGIEIGKEVTSKAAATICIGSCSCFGNIQAAKPNPTDAASVSKALGLTTINIAGCPPSPTNFIGTILHYLMFGAIPALDNLGRPVWAYGKRIHDYCERRPHYDASEFIAQWGDEGAKKAWCLYKLGCKGPYTFANCAKVRFNDGTSWRIMAGHGCIGCTEPAFWDTMTPFEKPIPETSIAQPLGGGEATVDDIAIVLTDVAVAGMAVHAGLTAYVHKNDDNDAHKQ